MKTSKYTMQAVGYALLSIFSNAEKEHPGSVQRMINKVGYTEYHNFWKCRLPLSWYKGILDTLYIDPEDLLVEVAKVKGNHAKDLHYHKISHAICIVLGPETGFPPCYYGSVVIDRQISPSDENLECYFPTMCEHTFHGGISTEDNEDGSLYFISIQSPPLLTKENDDFYFVYEQKEMD